MTPSTSSRNKRRNVLYRALAVLFWLGVWEITSIIIGQEILMVSPVRAVLRLSELMRTPDFYRSVAMSLLNIMKGFFLGMGLGCALAALAGRFGAVRLLCHPLMHAIKATPVASFVVVALIFIRSRNLSVFISFLMVLPIMYTNVLTGIDQTDRKLLEMAKVFRIGPWRTLKSVYVTGVYPHFLSACALSMGMCWKAGVAAEVLSLPKNAVGAQMYYSKLYLETADLFAWTVIVVLFSYLFEKLVQLFMQRKKSREESNEDR